VLPSRIRVAVGRRRGHRLRADHAAGAGLVLDDDRLIELLGELLAHDPSDHVAGASRRIGNDELDRARRERLRPRVAGDDEGQQRSQRCEKPRSHGSRSTDGSGWHNLYE
jgi:hypothetical protein